MQDRPCRPAGPERRDADAPHAAPDTRPAGVSTDTPWALCLLLAALAAAAYVVSLGGEFVWDDRRFIVENPHIQRPQSWIAFLTDASLADQQGAPGIVRPLRTLEFAADWALFGNAPFGFRLHSLAWHCAASALLLTVLRRLGISPRVAAVAAALWAVHPANVESVAFVSSRGDLAMGACTLAAVAMALRCGGRDRFLAGGLALAALAMLYKETAVALPVVILALRWTGRTRTPVWPWLAVSGAYLAYRAAVSSEPLRHGFEFVLGGSTQGTFSTMIRAFGFYLCEFVLPPNALDWQLPPTRTLADPQCLAWAAVHGTLLVSAVRARRSNPVWTLGVAWFYAFLLPVANWPVFIGIAIADRFLYLPLAGCALGLAALVEAAPSIARAGVRPRVAAGSVAALWVAAACLAVQTAARSRAWRSEEILWKVTRESHDSPRALQQGSLAARHTAFALRASVLRAEPGPERTALTERMLAEFQRSLDLAHRAIRVQNAFEMTDRSQSVLAHAFEEIASNVCHVLRRHEEALFHARAAVRIDGGTSATTQYDLALPLLALGFPHRATEAMRRSLALGIDNSDDEIAVFFVRAGALCEDEAMPAAALRDYETALALLRDAKARGEVQALRDRLIADPAARTPTAAETARAAELDRKLDALVLRCPDRDAADGTGGQ